MKDIVNLKAAVIFVGEFATAIDKSTKDGLGLDDIATFMPVALKAPGVFAGFSEVPSEFADLDAAERAEIVEALKVSLDLADDRTEIVAEQSFATVLDILALVDKIKGL